MSIHVLPLIHTVIFQRRGAALKKLIAQGYDIQARPPKNWRSGTPWAATPLEFAISRGHSPIVKILLDADAEVTDDAKRLASVSRYPDIQELINKL